MAVCPLSAAGILVHQAEGSAELKRLLRRVLEYRRIGWRWYLPIVFLNPAILLGSYRLMRWPGRPLGRPLPEPQVSLAAAPLLLVFLPPAVGEEAGWMGYAADPLRDRLGTVGALWHVVPLVQAHHDLAWIAWNCLETLAARILIVWLYNMVRLDLLLPRRSGYDALRELLKVAPGTKVLVVSSQTAPSGGTPGSGSWVRTATCRSGCRTRS